MSDNMEAILDMTVVNVLEYPSCTFETLQMGICTVIYAEIWKKTRI